MKLSPGGLSWITPHSEKGSGGRRVWQRRRLHPRPTTSGIDCHTGRNWQHEANLWSRTSFGNTRLDLHHSMPEGVAVYCIPVDQPTKNYKVAIPFRGEWNTQTPGPEGFLFIYIDGTKLNDRKAVFFCERLCFNESFRLPVHFSVFQAEVIAIKLVTGNQDVICIFSEQHLKLDGVSFNSRGVNDYRRSLNVAEQCDIHLLWVGTPMTRWSKGSQEKLCNGWTSKGRDYQPSSSGEKNY